MNDDRDEVRRSLRAVAYLLLTDVALCVIGIGVLLWGMLH